MKWKDSRRSTNVEDRRQSSGGGSGGLPSMGSVMMIWPLIKPLLRTKLGWAIIALGILAYMNGINPLAILGLEEQRTTIHTTDKEKENEQAAFISAVLGDTEEVWKEILPQYHMHYKDPKIVLYRGSTQSGCGYASAQMGPFYCPVDQKVYLDLGFFDELANRHNAPGDFAQAYVIAHEIGHHVQNLQGILSKAQLLKQQWNDEEKANALQVKIELQADCYAGIWAHHAQKRFNILEPGDIEEALNAAGSIGDDTLQKKATGYVRPDTFTHGTSQQRTEWFKRGLETGDVGECNTFQ